jgi:uncharacterized protein
VSDQEGRAVLALPAGFTYVTFGHIGRSLPGGGAFPARPDGMAVFPGSGGTVRLIRNHEVPGGAGSPGAVGGPAAARYDPAAGGGCVTLDYDPAGRSLVGAFVSLNGTTLNCSGGSSFGGGAWISAEESVVGPTGSTLPHGYCFSVPVDATCATLRAPLTAMGRFKHEAVAAHPTSGVLFETEDGYSDNATPLDRRSGFYRFLPVDPGRLESGGILEMLAIAGSPGYDARTGQQVGAARPVAWVPIGNPAPDPISNANRPFAQGLASGGAVFSRLEGVWWSNGWVFFVSTDGGNAGLGQVWRYRPDTQQLVLHYEAPAGGSALESPDGGVASPQGGLVLCEDDAVGNGDTHPAAPGISNVNRLIGIGADGVPFEFAVNRLNQSEFAGACFSPDNNTLFVNVYGNGALDSGMTCAITGPWSNGPL